MPNLLLRYVGKYFINIYHDKTFYLLLLLSILNMISTIADSGGGWIQEGVSHCQFSYFNFFYSKKNIIHTDCHIRNSYSYVVYWNVTNVVLYYLKVTWTTINYNTYYTISNLYVAPPSKYSESAIGLGYNMAM